MEKKELKKLVKAEIKTGATVKDEVFKSVFKLDPDMNVLQLMAEINRAFKKAGLTKSTSNAALKEAKDFIADDMPTFTTHKAMVDYASDLQDRFVINEDGDKGEKSALTAVRNHLKAEGEEIPKKLSLKGESAHTINYMNDAREEATKDGLAQYIEEEHGLTEIKDNPEATDEEKRKALRIRIGTKFNMNYHLVNNIDVEIED